MLETILRQWQRFPGSKIENYLSVTKYVNENIYSNSPEHEVPVPAPPINVPSAILYHQIEPSTTYKK
jgi:hypothetical protein